MKRNLISVIILALCIINFIMNAIIIFTVLPTNKKTNDLVTSIASIVDLSVENKEGESNAGEVKLSDITTFTPEEDETVSLKSDGSGTDHYAQLRVTVSLNTKSEDFATYDPASDTGITSKQSLIEAAIQDVFSNYTAEECRDNKAQITEECKEAVKKLFNNSDVIYDVTFSKYVIA